MAVQGSRNKSRDRGSENCRVRARDSCSTLTIKRLGETVQHPDDPIIAGSQFSINVFANVLQIFRQQQLITYLAARTSGDTDELAVLLAAESHRALH
jgi:hypothetical protein